ncbi:MAG: GtrA family protein [Methanobrevibacter woesei]|uniref:GtrA family protein n=1 Tax=Methanobrevibacter woesei TaxID=190976 RepID=UPI0023F48B8B|nr:GtrA family protein [Methanobrevibacter woesei]MCI7292069.1 GtrA family protein [Methanobrevibacter woesei]
MDELINKLFRKNTDNIFLQMFRYLFVGTASFLIDFFIYIGLIEIFNVNYLISAAIAFAISVMANYYLSTSWVFNQSNIENRVIEFNLFILISIMGLVFTEILLFIFIDWLSVGYIISKIIASILVMFWNFSARRVMFYGT